MSSAHVQQAISALSDLPSIAPGAQRVTSAVRGLRFSTGLRRAWKEARTEASVRYISLHVPQVSLSSIRHEIVENSEPTGWQEQGIWRVHADVVDAMYDLNRSDTTRVDITARTMLSRLYRDAHSTHPDPNIRQNAGLLTAEASADAELLVAMMESEGPGLLATSLIVGHMLDRPQPLIGYPWVRDAVIRWFLNIRGIEPTGTLVLDHRDFLTHLDEYRSGSRQGMDRWITHVVDVLVEATTGGLELANSILAGRTDPEFR